MGAAAPRRHAGADVAPRSPGLNRRWRGVHGMTDYKANERWAASRGAKIVAILTVVAVGVFLLGGEPVLALVVASLFPAGLVALRYPDLVPPVVVFLMYTNAGVIASKFHGVPMVVGAAVPLALLIPIAARFREGRDEIVLTPTLKAAGVFALYSLLGVTFALRRAGAVDAVFALVIEGVLLCALLVNAIRTPKTLKHSVWALVAAAAFLGAVSTHQQITQNFSNNYLGFAQMSDLQVEAFAARDEAEEEVAQPRMAGPVGEQNRYAQIMAMALPLGWLLVLGSESRRSRNLALLATLLIGAGIALSMSRGVILGLGATCVVMVLMGYVSSRQIALVAALSLVAAIAVPSLGTRLVSIGEVATSVLIKPKVGSSVPDGAVRGRLTEMKAAVLVFFDHPVLGVGPDQYRYYYQKYARRAGGRVHVGKYRSAHSLYLGLAAEHGLVGLALFIGLVFVTLRDSGRARRYWAELGDSQSSIISGALFLSLVTYLISAVFLHQAYIRYFWLLMGLASAALYLRPESTPMLSGDQAQDGSERDDSNMEAAWSPA